MPSNPDSPAGDGGILGAVLAEVRQLSADVRAILGAPPETPAPPDGARYSYAEAATRLGISERTVRMYVATGELRPLRYGRRCVFTEAQLTAFERESAARGPRPVRARKTRAR